ncbi:slipin family protein [Salinarimonas sp. NSM]|uniref:slipin family protein n=1 Tax=Salinarimonas sp. NSM TaxID=3458003 RepID=UPI00403625B0
MGLDLVAYLVIALVVLGIVASAIRIMREYERAVVFTLGRYSGVRGPGIIFVIPFLQQAVKVDMRTITMDVPSQDVISKDNVSVKVNAVIYFRVVDADRSIIQVEDYMMATSQLAQTTLRSVLGKHDLDEMLSERDKLNSDIQEILDSQTDAWGIKVANVEIKHVDIDESMVRAIARQAEAERNRRARIIDAEGEMQASQKLSEAAGILSQTPEAMQLRFLSTLYDIAGDKNSTIVFPVPIDLLRGFVGAPAGPSSGASSGAGAAPANAGSRDAGPPEAAPGEWQKPAG